MAIMREGNGDIKSESAGLGKHELGREINPKGFEPHFYFGKLTGFFFWNFDLFRFKAF
jgi:hypothetical protein